MRTPSRGLQLFVFTTALVCPELISALAVLLVAMLAAEMKHPRWGAVLPGSVAGWLA